MPSRAVAMMKGTLMRDRTLTEQEIKEKIQEVNRIIGSFGENVVADYMADQGWRPTYPETLGTAMMEIGAQTRVEESPERFIDRAFWRYADNSLSDIEGEVEWELIQVKTTCVESYSFSCLSVCIPPYTLDRYLRYTKKAMALINHAGRSCPFPSLTKFNIYIVCPDGVFRIDMMDIEKYSTRVNRSQVLKIDRHACDPVMNWAIDQKHEYSLMCDERRKYQNILTKMHSNPQQQSLRLGGSL